MLETKISEESYQVSITIKKREKVEVDKNGRGYDADKTTHTNVSEPLDVQFDATSIESIIKKANAHLETLKED